MRDLDAVLDGQPTPPAPDPEPEHCEFCDGPIRWLTSRTGKRMPVDAYPSPRGNVIIRGDRAGVLGPVPAAAAREHGEQLHLHHVVECPHADRWNAKAREAGRRSQPAPPRRRVGGRR